MISHDRWFLDRIATHILAFEGDSQVVAALVGVGDLHRVAETQAAGVGLFLADDHAEERGLAGAVGPDDADDAAARQGEGQAVDEEVVAVTLAQSLALDHQVAQPGPGRDVDLVLLDALGRVAVLGQQLLVVGEARLALGLTGARAHPHPFQLALERPPAGGFLLLLERQALLLLVEPGRVVALPRDAAAAVQLEDPAGHVVEEVAVVGDRHDRPGILGEEALQPGHRLGIEVVGRLVEQQQVGPLQQQPAERHPPALASRQAADGGVAGRQAQRVHGDLERAVELPGVGRVDRVLHPGLLLEQLLHLLGREVLAEARIDLVEAGEQLAGAGDPLLDVAQHVLGLVEPRLLLQVADLDPLGRPRLAAEVGDGAGHDLEQRALAGAVQAQHADLRARQERQPDALQDLAVGRVHLPQVLHHIDVLLCHGRS